MSLDVPDASTKKIYRLKPKYKGNEEALAVLAGITSFPTTFEEGSHIETKLRASGFSLYSIMSGFRNYNTGQMYEVEGFFVRS